MLSHLLYSHLNVCFPEPFPVSAVKYDVLNVSAVKLSWSRPQEYHSGFSYQVLVSNCTENSRNLSIVSENITVPDLQPGTLCQFSLYSLACGILGEPVNISVFTSMYSHTCPPLSDILFAPLPLGRQYWSIINVSEYVPCILCLLFSCLIKRIYCNCTQYTVIKN